MLRVSVRYFLKLWQWMKRWCHKCTSPNPILKALCPFPRCHKSLSFSWSCEYRISEYWILCKRGCYTSVRPLVGRLGKQAQELAVVQGSYLYSFGDVHPGWRPEAYMITRLGWLQNEDRRPKPKIEDPFKIVLKSFKIGSNMILNWSRTRSNKICGFYWF